MFFPNVLVTTFSLLILTSQVTFSQGWVAQTSGTTKNLRGVFFVTTNIGTVVGDQGTVLRTTNGGTTWTSQTTPTSKHLNDVEFINTTTGVVVGDEGVILRTTNGGSTWTSIAGGTSSNLRSIDFENDSIATVVGQNGRILRSTNRGLTWTSQTSGTSVELRGVSTPATNIGTAAGNSGTIRRTTDGGATWVGQTSGVTDNLRAVSFADQNSGIVAGDKGRLLQTSNGGTAWSLRNSRTTRNLKGAWLFSSMVGSVVGDRGTILRTTDGGSMWVGQSSGTTKNLRAVHFSDALTGTAVGDGGTIRRTTDGGGSDPFLSLEQDSIYFGNVVTGFSKVDTLTVTNIGAKKLTITSIGSTNIRFSVTPTSGLLDPFDSMLVYITFSPVSVGVQNGGIIFMHDAFTSPDTLYVTGYGVAPGFTVNPYSLDFDEVLVGTGKQDSVVVTNLGSSTLTISSVVSNNARFSVSPTSAGLAPSASAKFTITFTPTVSGMETGEIIFTHSGATSPDTVSVVGTGVQPGFAVSPGSLAFGDVLVGLSKGDTVTVTNTGTSPLRSRWWLRTTVSFR